MSLVELAVTQEVAHGKPRHANHHDHRVVAVVVVVVLSLKTAPLRLNSRSADVPPPVA